VVRDGGDVDNAIRPLERLAEERHPDVLWLTNPLLDALRPGPRCRALVKRVDLPINE
jgi:hypothetical protein